MPKLTGSCMCGSVSFEADCEIGLALNCHCTNCQKLTGSVFGTNIFVPENTVKISGTLSEYQHTADSGSKMNRMFCPTCGSPVLSTNSARPGMVGIRAGAINEKDEIAPTINIYCDSAVPTTVMDNKMKKFNKMPI